MKRQNVGARVGRLYALLSLAVLVPVLSLAFLAKGQADAAPLAVAPSRTCSATYQESPSVPYSAVAHIGGTKFAVARQAGPPKILIVDYTVPPSSYDYANNYITFAEYTSITVKSIIDLTGTNYFVVALGYPGFIVFGRIDKSSYAPLWFPESTKIWDSEVALAWDTTNSKLIVAKRTNPQTVNVYNLDGTLYRSYTLDSNSIAQVLTIAHLGGTYVAHAGTKSGQAAKIIVVDYETGQVVNNITAGDSISDSTIPSLVKEPGQDRLYSAQQLTAKTKI